MVLTYCQAYFKVRGVNLHNETYTMKPQDASVNQTIGYCMIVWFTLAWTDSSDFRTRSKPIKRELLTKSLEDIKNNTHESLHV